LLFIDLDHFKDVNDSAGHAVGDELLREAAARLRRCVRSCDALARMGGDEFTIIISDLGEERAPEVVARHVLDALCQPYMAGHAEHFLTASIGIAVHPADGETLEELLRNADTAMYRAKEAGRNRFVYFEERMNAAAVARVSMERQLRRALDGGEFRLVYQAQFALATGQVAAAEALLRWRRDDGTLLLPGSFIAHAEETGIIERIGAWVLEEACRQQSEWLREGVAPPRIAVNVSAQQFRRADFPAEVERVLAQTGVPPTALELEITESLLMDPSRNVERSLERLAGLGVRIALDDFGTGYSSLAYLKRFPVDVVKIDRAFVADLEGDASSVAICGAIVGMAHALAKDVVAEGVETSAQATVLRRLGCDFVQGYHYAAPLSPAEYAGRLLRPAEREPVAVQA